MAAKRSSKCTSTRQEDIGQIFLKRQELIRVCEVDFLFYDCERKNHQRLFNKRVSCVPCEVSRFAP